MPSAREKLLLLEQPSRVSTPLVWTVPSNPASESVFCALPTPQLTMAPYGLPLVEPLLGEGDA